MTVSTKLKVCVLVVAMLGIAALLSLQQQQIRRLAAENADLRTRLSQIASLQDTNEHLAGDLKAAVERSQANQNELMRLRGQEVRLRQLEQENTQLKAQREQLDQQRRDAQTAATPLEQLAQRAWSSNSTLVLGPEISIDRLNSGMTIQQIIAELGQPTRTTASALEFSNLGLFITPYKGEVVLFPPFAGRTEQGIGMGSSRADVIQAYGEPTVVNPTTDPAFDILSYESRGLKFQVHEGKVDWIQVISQRAK
jgi:hypothetical protein